MQLRTEIMYKVYQVKVQNMSWEQEEYKQINKTNNTIILVSHHSSFAKK